MKDIPKDDGLDNTVALLSEGYDFLPRRCRRLGSQIFQTRLMGRTAICVQGEEWAKAFYASDRFTRRRALPPTTLMSLQDVGSVQTLDGPAHRARKAMFMGLMTPAAVARMGDAFEAEWRARLPAWSAARRVALQDEVTAILCRAVATWVGLRLGEREARDRTRELAAMIDGAGAIGLRNWRGLLLRSRTERWARRTIVGVRQGAIPAAQQSSVQAVASYRDPGGRALPARTAAVELINLMRPTVAIHRFVVFAALALHDHPDWRARLGDADDATLEAFAQEVRRYYPFFPAVAGRALADVEHDGYRISRGSWVLLDLYGTDHDATRWDAPDRFRPERFLERPFDADASIPQGAGDHWTGHRCPGEAITLEVIKRAARLLATAMRYEVPAQDLVVDRRRIPTGPRSGFVIEQVAAVG